MEGRLALAVSLIALGVAVAALVRPSAPAPEGVAGTNGEAAVAETDLAENAEDLAAANLEGGGVTGSARATGKMPASPAPAMGQMSSHFASLWFAAKNENLELAQYELREMQEAIDSLQGRKLRGVDIGAVGAERLELPFAHMKTALDEGSWKTFDEAYHRTIEACNTCHDDLRVGFIDITVPEEPPQPNRRWAPS